MLRVELCRQKGVLIWMIDPFTIFYPSFASTTIAIYHAANNVVSALPTSLSLFSLVVTFASIILCSVIAMYFYRSYRFSGFGYLLGLPTGFAILAASLRATNLKNWE